MEWFSGWLPWSSLGTLKLAFNISSDDQGSHPDDLSISVFDILIVWDENHSSMKSTLPEFWLLKLENLD